MAISNPQPAQHILDLQNSLWRRDPTPSHHLSVFVFIPFILDQAFGQTIKIPLI
jgi:hypothetical protein